jgi:hypothetical protein
MSNLFVINDYLVDSLFIKQSDCHSITGSNIVNLVESRFSSVVAARFVFYN